MKVLFLGRYNASEILSGPEKVAKKLFTEINKVNSKAEFISYFFKLDKERSFEEIFFKEELISNNPPIYRLGLIKILKKIIEYKPNLIHVITFERFVLPVLFLKLFLRFKLVYTVHGIYKYERKNFIKKPKLFSDLKDLLIEGLIFKTSDSIVFLSYQSIELAETYYRISKDKVTIIPNGVSLPSFSINKKFNYSNNLELVFYNGLGESQNRGLETLINILNSEIKLDFNLSVLGRYFPFNSDRINSIVALSSENLQIFLKEKDIFIDTLSFTTFSIMALEAMSMGLIVIVNNKSGISNFIVQGENGFIFNQNNPLELAVILNKIYQKKYDLEKISKNASETAKQLTWEVIAKKYYEHYCTILI